MEIYKKPHIPCNLVRLCVVPRSDVAGKGGALNNQTPSGPLRSSQKISSLPPTTLKAPSCILNPIPSLFHITRPHPRSLLHSHQTRLKHYRTHTHPFNLIPPIANSTHRNTPTIAPRDRETDPPSQWLRLLSQMSCRAGSILLRATPDAPQLTSIYIYSTSGLQ